MAQKAWMQAYTKGSKSLQARLSKIHANNPEFQDFVSKHGFGSTLTAKQSGQQKASVATVKPVDQPHPESKKGPVDREAMIKAAFEKAKDRRRAHSNRVAFGGELGGSFHLPLGGFRRYSESTEINELSDKRLSTYVKKATKSADRLAYYSDSRNDPDWIKSNKREKMIAVAKKKLGESKELDKPVKFDKPKPEVTLTKGLLGKKRTVSLLQAKIMQKSGWKVVKEDVPYRDAMLTMRKGGWIVKRNGKQQGVIHPTEELAKLFADNTRKTLAYKLGDVIRRKARDIARGMGGHNALANESAANRNRIRSWDSAVLPVEHDHPLTTTPKSKPPFTPDKPKKNLGIVVGKNDPGYSRARHLARLGLKKAMATNEAQDPKVLALRAAGRHEDARKLERAALAKGFSAAKRDTLNKPGEKRKPDQEQLRIDSQKWHNGD